MLHVNVCEECGVPETFNAAHKWLNNGDIVQRANQKARMSFIECENLDPLFTNIGKIIGFPIESLIINLTSRGTALYMKEVVPKEMRKLVKEGQVSIGVLVKPITTLCHVLGYGKYESSCAIYAGNEDDFYKQTIFNPFSVPEAAGVLAGAIAAVVGGEHSVTYEEIAPGLFEFTTAWTVYPVALKKRLHITSYEHRDGDIELERCTTCGAPKAFSMFHWDLDNGLIVDERTGRRMAILGSQMLDNLFDALENELGDTIPEVIVEAQRRFTKTGFYSINDVRSEEDFRTQLALRGMGNLRDFKMGVGGMRMRIDNTSGHLMTVGVAQGIFETALDVESYVEWELSEDGDLTLEVTPCRN
jgi:hypothetical protein